MDIDLEYKNMIDILKMENLTYDRKLKIWRKSKRNKNKNKIQLNIFDVLDLIDAENKEKSKNSKARLFHKDQRSLIIDRTAKIKSLFKTRIKKYKIDKFNFKSYINKTNLIWDYDGDKLRTKVGSLLIGRDTYKMRSVILKLRDGGKVSTPFKGSYREIMRALDALIVTRRGTYEEQSVIVDLIEISSTDRVTGGQGGAGRSIANANSTWKEISPSTRLNCLYTSYLIAEGSPAKKLAVASAKLKKLVNPSNRQWSDESTVQELSDYKKRDIIIYNNIYCKLWVIKTAREPTRTKAKAPIEIRLSNNHFTALVRLTKNEKSNIKENKPFNQIDDEEPIPIEKEKSSFKNYSNNKNFCTWDIETTARQDGVCIPYAVGLCWNSKTKQFWGLDCMDQFIRFLIDNGSEFKHTTFYAHNGGKFDNNFLLQALVKYDKDIHIGGNTELNGRWLNLTLLSDSFKKINFRDSCTFFTDSLDNVCKDFKVKHQKLIETVKHCDVLPSNFLDFKDKMSKYLDNDVLGLYEALEMFNELIWNASKRSWIDKKTGKTVTRGVNICDCYTNATLAKKIFYLNYYGSHPVYQLNKGIDSYIRDSYFGGRVESSFEGEISGKLYYRDFTSLYPSQMTGYLPCGKPIFTNGCDINPRAFYGFIRCTVKSTEKGFDHKPLHAVKGKNGLFFPHIKDPREMTLFSEELKLGLKSGLYEYEILDGYKFERMPLMKKFINDFYKIKEQAEEDGNDVLRSIAKVVINSSYGFWGLRTNDRDGVTISRVPLFEKSLSEGKLISVGKVGQYYIQRELSDIPITNINVGIAAAITSLGRMRLWNIMSDIEELGGTIHYCDTDSIITDYNIEESKDLMKEYCWDGNGKSLGSLKDEGLKKNINYFEGVYIGGKKQYCLRNGPPKNWHPPMAKYEEKLTTSCKGFNFKSDSKGKYICKMNEHTAETSKDYLTFDLFKNQGIQGHQLGFQCSKSNFVSETNSFQVTRTITQKAIKTNYLTGIVNNDQTISPLVI